MGVLLDGFSELSRFGPWLDGLPENKKPVFSRIISSRSACRVFLSVTHWYLSCVSKKKWHSDLIISTIFCLLLSRVGARSLTNQVDIKLQFAANFAVAFADLAVSSADVGFLQTSQRSSRRRSPAFYATRSAAFSVISSKGAAGFAADSALSASDYKAISRAVYADARALEAGATPEEMAARPLWPEESPYKPQFDRKAFLAAAPTFEVWLDWYEPIVEGKAPWGLPRDIANSLETRIALGDGRGEGGKDFWERDADEVNAEIKEWVEAARAEVAAAWMHLQMSILENEQALAQRPAPHQFDEVDGKIVAFPMKSNRREDDFAKDMWDELVAKANATRDRLERSQSPRHIIDAFDRLIAGLGNTFEEVRPGKLLMQSNTIETVAASYDTPEMRGELAADCLSLVKDLSESLTDFKALFPEILDIEAMRLAQKIAGDSTNAILVQTRKIAVIAAESDSVDQSVSDAFNAAFAEIEEQERLAAEGQNDLAIAAANTKKAETAALHTLDIRNFVARVLKSRPAKLIGKVATDYTEDFYKGSRKGMEKLGENSVRAAITTIVFYLAGPVAALALLLHSFNPLAKKAAEIEADDPGKIGPQ